MWDMLYYLAIVLFLAVAMIGGAYAARTYFGGSPSFHAVSSLFGGPKPLRRLSVSEQFNLDNRRRLILIRRDNVEHLIMTGGPVDVVIETGIASHPFAGHDEEAAQAAALRPRVDPTLA